MRPRVFRLASGDEIALHRFAPIWPMLGDLSSAPVPLMTTTRVDGSVFPIGFADRVSLTTAPRSWQRRIPKRNQNPYSPEFSRVDQTEVEFKTDPKDAASEAALDRFLDKVYDVMVTCAPALTDRPSELGHLMKVTVHKGLPPWRAVFFPANTTDLSPATFDRHMQACLRRLGGVADQYGRKNIDPAAEYAAQPLTSNLGTPWPVSRMLARVLVPVALGLDPLTQRAMFSEWLDRHGVPRAALFAALWSFRGMALFKTVQLIALIGPILSAIAVTLGAQQRIRPIRMMPACTAIPLSVPQRAMSNARKMTFSGCRSLGPMRIALAGQVTRAVGVDVDAIRFAIVRAASKAGLLRPLVSEQIVADADNVKLTVLLHITATKGAALILVAIDIGNFDDSVKEHQQRSCATGIRKNRFADDATADLFAEIETAGIVVPSQHQLAPTAADTEQSMELAGLPQGTHTGDKLTTEAGTAISGAVVDEAIDRFLSACAAEGLTVMEWEPGDTFLDLPTVYARWAEAPEDAVCVAVLLQGDDVKLIVRCPPRLRARLVALLDTIVKGTYHNRGYDAKVEADQAFLMRYRIVLGYDIEMGSRDWVGADPATLAYAADAPAVVSVAPAGRTTVKTACPERAGKGRWALGRLMLALRARLSMPTDPALVEPLFAMLKAVPIIGSKMPWLHPNTSPLEYAARCSKDVALFIRRAESSKVVGNLFDDVLHSALEALSGEADIDADLISAVQDPLAEFGGSALVRAKLQASTAAAANLPPALRQATSRLLDAVVEGRSVAGFHDTIRSLPLPIREMVDLAMRIDSVQHGEIDEIALSTRDLF